jgi:glycosyltransferase involved in cell wall biosynthesis
VHLLIVGKAAFGRVVDGVPVPISLAGHSVQFIRPLISYALERGATVSYAYPLLPSESDCLLFDSEDHLPAGVAEVPFTELSAGKSPLHIGWLSVEASVRQAMERHGPIDWVILASAFPLATILAQVKPRYGYKLALFIRGHDGYQWLDPDWAARALGDPGRTRHISHIYREALLSADLIGVASQWLGDVVTAHGVPYDLVVESPAAMGPGRWAKAALAAEPSVVVRHGRPDPARKWLLSAGRIHPDKQVGLAAESFAAASLDGWQFVLAGAGAEPEGPLAELIDRDLACVMEVPPRVVHGIFQVSDAYLQTSLPSGSFIDARPSSVTSAAFHGMPVIMPVASAGGAAESVSAENCATFGFDVRDLDPADVIQRAEILRRAAAAIQRLRDVGLSARIGAANAEHARESSVDAVFNRIWARLNPCVKDGD